MSEFEFHKSQRGGELLFYEDHIYNMDCKKTEDGQRWRCRKRNCRSFLWVSTTNEVRFSKELHNHSNCSVEIEKLKILEKIKNDSFLRKNVVLI
jgi:hypothetical protein